MFISSSLRQSGTILVAVLWSLCGLAAAADAEVRDRAVLSLTMQPHLDGTVTALTDDARTGSADAVTVNGEAKLIPSVFGNETDGHSIVLDPAAAQYIVVASSDDVSSPDAVTISGLFASLHMPSDKGFHGLFAKRQPDGKSITNYGINYDHASDVFQLYVNDGTGFRVAQYRVKQVLGSRRRVHLTASFRNADAPDGTDQDQDVDDIQMRLFVNGAVVKPNSVPQGFIDGNSAWVTDTSLTNCVSDTPLTIAASAANAELTHLIADDFLVFREALSDKEAAALFREVCGAASDALLTEQKGSSKAGVGAPTIARLSTRGATIGSTAEVIVDGTQMQRAELVFNLPGIDAERLAGATADRAVFRVAVEGQMIPARCLVRTVTDAGASAPAVFCVDRLTQVYDGQYTQQNPATSLPIAVSGFLSGTDQKQTWFVGRKGDVIVAEVEARRLASGLDPVVEIKNQAGGPLAIQWQQTELGGDARARATLPADGVYVAEVHDMQYRAPANSHFRLLLGSLRAASLAFPAAADAADGESRLLGSVAADSEPATSRSSLLPVPALAESEGEVIVESDTGGFGDQPHDATFTTAPFPPVSFWGRISSNQQVDQIALKVTPGQKLFVSAFARRLSSPLRPEISILVDNKRVAGSNGDAGARDASLTWQVPEKVDSIVIEVRDFTNQGSPASMYRLDVGRTDRTGFQIAAVDDTVAVPINGSVPLRLRVTRQSEAFQYRGPLRLQVRGADGLRVVPDVLPANDKNEDTLVLLVRDSASSENSVSALSITASSVGLEPAVQETLVIPVAGINQNAVRGVGDHLLATAAAAAPAHVALNGAPPVLFRGATAVVPIRIMPQQDGIAPFVKFSLVTTQQVRKENAADPKSADKPLVRAADYQFAESGVTEHDLRVRVPFDTPEQSLTAVVQAEFDEQPLANSADAAVWSAPIQLPVRDAVKLTADVAALKLAAGTTGQLQLSLVRHPLYSQPIRIQLDGLPPEMHAEPVILADDQPTPLVLTVKAAASAATGEVAGVTLLALTSDGVRLAAPQAIAISVLPAATDVSE